MLILHQPPGSLGSCADDADTMLVVLDRLWQAQMLENLDAALGDDLASTAQDLPRLTNRLDVGSVRVMEVSPHRVPSRGGVLIRTTMTAAPGFLAVNVPIGLVFAELVRSHRVWVIPAGGAADWADIEEARVRRYGPGGILLAPGPDDGLEGALWLRFPLRPATFADPGVLRAGIGFVMGSPEDAAALDLVVCRVCRSSSRSGQLTGGVMGPSGPLCSSYGCFRCWRTTGAGGEGRHLRVVSRGSS